MAGKHDKAEKHDKLGKVEKAEKAERHNNGRHAHTHEANGHAHATVEQSMTQVRHLGRRYDGPVALVGGRLIDGTGAEPIDTGVLVFEGERILAVGRRDEVRVPRGATVIEADGMTVMPGLIDCHVHLAGQWGYDLVRRLLTPPSLSLLYAVPNAQATVEAGITTVRDAGGTPASVKLAVERGLFAGPRMLVAVSVLSQTGGHGDSFMPCCIDMKQSLPADIPYSVVDGQDQMRHKVREVLRADADWIKLCTSGGVLSPADSPESAQFTVDEIGVAVYEAAAQGKRCMAHAQSNRGIKNALEAGIASIEHGIYLDDEAIQMMVDRGVYLVPTLVAPQDVIELAEARPGLLPPYAVEKAQQVIKTHRESFRRAVEAGVKVAMGTDSGVGPHGGNARELRLMVEHGGMAAMQAIVASTRSAAELLRLDDRLGTLAAGKLADVLVVNGDPLADMRVLEDTQNMLLVLKGGVAMREQVSPAKRLVPVMA